MTLIYLASPGTQQQAEHATGFPVLLSFGAWREWLSRYAHVFSRLLLDSGAFSELNSGTRVDLAAYIDWVARFEDQMDAYAGLDDISGDWRRSLKNYEAGGFPTFHDTDPVDLLNDLIQLARERGNWIGIGLNPPRHGKERFIRETLDRIPEDIHIHGWALRGYARFRRFNSIDSTNWWRSAMQINQMLPWLHFGECLDIQVKRLARAERHMQTAREEQVDLWECR